MATTMAMAMATTQVTQMSQSDLVVVVVVKVVEDRALMWMELQCVLLLVKPN
jgi:hypothetical protein